jgi:hypothetical protein
MNYPAITIADAAVELNRLHGEIETKLRTTVQDAIRAGEILTQVKDRLDHGEFLPWIERNCEFSRQTADNYRRLYDHRGKLPTVSNLQEAYQQIETIERQQKQTEEQRAQERIREYRETGVKPEGWRRGTDDKLAEEERRRDERIEKEKQRMEAERLKREAEKNEREARWERIEQETDFTSQLLNDAADHSLTTLKKRQDFKDRIRVSSEGRDDVFIDALMDYLEELPDDNRRIEACYNIIKVAKGVAVELQAGNNGG